MAGMIRQQDHGRCGYGWRVVLLLLGITPAWLVGCATTEELYAVYDDANCAIPEVGGANAASPVALIKADTTAIATPLDTPDGWDESGRFRWEPAVFFDYNMDQLSWRGKSSLQSTIAALQANPELTVGLQGFTDTVGNRRFNLALAGRRVDSVRLHLVAAGIDQHRIIEQPVGQVDHDTSVSISSEGAYERRVELMLMNQDGQPLVLHFVAGQQ